KISITNVGSSISVRINGANLDINGTAVNQVIQQSLTGTTPGSAKSPNPNVDLSMSGRSGLEPMEQHTESMEKSLTVGANRSSFVTMVQGFLGLEAASPKSDFGVKIHRLNTVQGSDRTWSPNESSDEEFDGPEGAGRGSGCPSPEPTLKTTQKKKHP
ncbi:hypothetical protein HAX54_015515, partial [Datura stramonium]|nr:hypothetical protein [Datura stramonium]